METRPSAGLAPDRPLGVGHVIGGALRFVRRHPVVTVGTPVGAYLIGGYAALAVLFAYGGFQFPAQYDLPEAMGVVTLVGVCLLIGGSFVVGTLCTVLRCAVRGERVRLVDAWRAGLRSTPGLVAVHLLAGGIVVSIVAVGLLPLVLTAALRVRVSGLLVVLFVLIACVAVVVAVVVGVSLTMVGPAYVLDGGGVLRALSRSREMTYGSFWRVLGTMLLVGLLFQVVYPAITAICLLVALPVVSFFDGASDVPFQAVGIGAGVLLAATVPFTVGVLGLLYLDLRYRLLGRSHTA